MKFFKAKQMIEDRKAEGRARLKKLRVDLADDIPVDPDEISQIMRDAGVDLEEIERQVAELKSRRAMVAKIAECKLQNARAAEIDEEIKAANDAFSITLQKHQQHVASLRNKQTEMGGRFLMCDAEAKLHRGATDPDLLAAKKELASQRLALVERQKGLEYQQSRHRESISVLNSEIARQRSLDATPNPRLATEIKLHEDKEKGLDPELKLVSEAIQELEAQAGELHLRELDPNCF